MNLIGKAYAVDIGNVWMNQQSNGGFQSLGDMVSFFLPKILLLAGIMCFLMVVIAGFSMITGAGGDPQATEKARQYVTYGVIGLVIVVSAFWILQLINFITGGSLSGNEGIL